MVYLKEFTLLSEYEEDAVFSSDKRTIHNNTYPLGIFINKKLKSVTFNNITIFYGGNGSGKTTLEIISTSMYQSVLMKITFLPLMKLNLFLVMMYLTLF